MLVSMLPLFGTDGLESLLDIHRYAGLLAVVTLFMHFYCVLLQRAQLRIGAGSSHGMLSGFVVPCPGGSVSGQAFGKADAACSTAPAARSPSPKLAGVRLGCPCYRCFKSACFARASVSRVRVYFCRGLPAVFREASG